MNRPRMALALVLLGALAAPAAEPEQKPAEEKKPPEVLAEFKIEKGCRPIILPVTIKGKQYLFLLDTAAPQTFFDASFRPKPSLFDEPEFIAMRTSTGSVVNVEGFSAPAMFLDKLKVRNARMAPLYDLKTLRCSMGRDLHGILGLDCLKDFVVQIDPDKGRIGFMSADYAEPSKWGQDFPLVLHEEGFLQVPIDIPGAGDFKCIVDTGFDGNLMLSPNVFAAAIKQGNFVENELVTLTRQNRSRTGRLNSFSIGPFEHRGMTAGEWKERCPMGMGLLSRYVVTLDFPRMKMHLVKGKRFAETDEIDMSGLSSLGRMEAKTLVGSVAGGTPAEQAGIKAGDIIHAVNGQDAAKMDLYDLRDLLKSGDGKEIKMTIKRGDEEKAVTFKLKKRI
jgi:hypothetical protein